MPRPGTTLSRSETRTSRASRTTIGPWFIAGITGTVDADSAGPRKPVTNITDYATRFGSRASHATPEMYDAAENYLKDGGSTLFVSKTTDTTDTALATALGLFGRDLGPGQVSAPGRGSITAGTGISAAAQKLLLAQHGEANNRLAIINNSDTATVATMTAEATIASITQNQERYASMWGPWITVPGATPGTTKTISPESAVAARMAWNDAHGVSPNQPSAGPQYGVSPTALDVTHNYIEADRTTLNANGVNLLRNIDGDVQLYGYRTLADASSDSNWVDLSNARMFMAIQAECDAVAARYVFRELDGQRRTISEFGGALVAVILPYWQRGSLYGTAPEEAFRVDVGENVNTDSTIANKELRASIVLRVSEFAEEVKIDLVKTRTTEAV